MCLAHTRFWVSPDRSLLRSSGISLAASPPVACGASGFPLPARQDLPTRRRLIGARFGLIVFLRGNLRSTFPMIVGLLWYAGALYGVS